MRNPSTLKCRAYHQNILGKQLTVSDGNIIGTLRDIFIILSGRALTSL